MGSAGSHGPTFFFNQLLKEDHRFCCKGCLVVPTRDQNDLTCFSRCSFLNYNQARATSTGVPFAKRHIRLRLCLFCQVCTWCLNHFETRWFVPISSGLRHPIVLTWWLHRIEALSSLQSQLGNYLALTCKS